MKLLLILTTWFIISIPASVLLGRFCAVSDGFLAASASSPEKESDTLADYETMEEHPAEKAA